MSTMQIVNKQPRWRCGACGEYAVTSRFVHYRLWGLAVWVWCTECHAYKVYGRGAFLVPLNPYPYPGIEQAALCLKYK